MRSVRAKGSEKVQVSSEGSTQEAPGSTVRKLQAEVIELARLLAEGYGGAVEAERRRVAREIHDTLAQDLIGILTQLQAAESLLEEEPERSRSCIRRAIQEARAGIEHVRCSAWALEPEILAYSSLQQRLEEWVEETRAGTTVRLEMSTAGSPRLLLPNVGLNLLRIAQEAVRNALRHASPERVEITLESGQEEVMLSVRDDGNGFDPDSLPAGGFGLIVMHQRAQQIGADLLITSGPGAGTEVVATVPVPQEAAP